MRTYYSRHYSTLHCFIFNNSEIRLRGFFSFFYLPKITQHEVQRNYRRHCR